MLIIVRLLIADKPDPPGKPEVLDSNRDFITIKWEPPKKDGGAPITGYNVERKDPKTGRWTKVNSEPLKVCDLRG
jgi:hypothetical protein